MSRGWLVKAGLLQNDDDAVTKPMSPERNSPLVIFLASDEAK
jgi:hypothetical protein